MEEVEEGASKSESREKGIGLPVIECFDEQWFYQNALKLVVSSSAGGSSCPSGATAMLNSTEVNANQVCEEVGSANIRGNIEGTSEAIVRRPCLLRSPSLPPRVGGKENSHGGDGTPDRLKKHDLPPKLENRGSSSMMKLPGIPRPKQSKTSQSSRKEPVAARRHRRIKSLSDLEFEEVKGFADLGFVFDEENPSPDMVSVIPGLRRRSSQEAEETEKVRRPYLSEAWLVQRRELMPLKIPPPPKSEPHMKAHLKVWAKSVATAAREGY